jgi:hypothetical protein
MLFEGRESGGDWRAVGAPSPIWTAVATPGAWWLRTEESLHRTGDRGASFAACALPAPSNGPVVLGPARPWVAAGDRIVTREGDAWVTLWVLPAGRGDERIADLRLAGDEIFAATNRRRIYRGRAGQRQLEDYSQGLPPPLADGGGSETPTMSMIDDWQLAFTGGLYLRRPGDPAWAPLLEPTAPPELAGVAASQSADWVRSPWDEGVWIGTDGMALLECGPRRPLRRRWRPPEIGLHMAKGLTAGASTVILSLRRATGALSGVAVRQGGAVEPIALPEIPA